jgi:hypothetical protein|nr:MAG TPA: hypothetical protein [Caudoviricetes sp.]
MLQQISYTQNTQFAHSAIQQLLNQHITNADTVLRQVVRQVIQNQPQYFQEVYNTIIHFVEAETIQGRLNPQDGNALNGAVYNIFNNYVAYMASNLGEQNLPAGAINYQNRQAIQQSAADYVNTRDGVMRFLVSYYQSQARQPVQQPFAQQSQFMGNTMPMQGFGQMPQMGNQMGFNQFGQMSQNQFGGGFSLMASNAGSTNTANMNMNLMGNPNTQPTQSKPVSDQEIQSSYFNFGNRNGNSNSDSSNNGSPFSYYTNTGLSDEEIEERGTKQLRDQLSAENESRRKRYLEETAREYEEYEAQQRQEAIIQQPEIYTGDEFEDFIEDMSATTPEEKQYFYHQLADENKAKAALAELERREAEEEQQYANDWDNQTLVMDNIHSTKPYVAPVSVQEAPVESEEDRIIRTQGSEVPPAENVPVRVVKRKPRRVINNSWMAIPEKGLDVWTEGNKELDEHRHDYAPREMYPVYDHEIEWVEEEGEEVGYLNYKAEDRYYREVVAFRNPAWTTWILTKYTEIGYRVDLNEYDYPVQVTYKLSEEERMERERHIIPNTKPDTRFMSNGNPYSEGHNDTSLLKAADNLLLSEEEMQEQLAKLTEAEKEYAYVEYDGITREVSNDQEIVNTCLLNRRLNNPDAKAAVFRIVSSNLAFSETNQDELLKEIKHCETMEEFYDNIYTPLKKAEPVLAKRLSDVLDRAYARLLVKCGLPNVKVTCVIDIYPAVENTQFKHHPLRKEQYRIALQEMFQDFLSEEFMGEDILTSSEDPESKYMAVIPVTGSVVVVDKELNEFEGLVSPTGRKDRSSWYELAIDDHVELNTFLINLMERNKHHSKEFYLVTKDGVLIEAIKGFNTLTKADKVYVRIVC